MPHKFDFPKVKLPKGERTLSGDFILQRRGGDMWNKLKESLAKEYDDPEYGDDYYRSGIWFAKEKIKAIEKEYGIDYIE